MYLIFLYKDKSKLFKNPFLCQLTPHSITNYNSNSALNEKYASNDVTVIFKNSAYLTLATWLYIINAVQWQDWNELFKYKSYYEINMWC